MLDVGPVLMLAEIKTDKAKWSKTYEGLLEQPTKYAERYRETRPVIPFLLMQLRQGRGRPWKRQVALEADMFRDLILAFMEREQYIAKLEAEKKPRAFHPISHRDVVCPSCGKILGEHTIVRTPNGTEFICPKEES